jgi:hypothetical protein
MSPPEKGWIAAVCVCRICTHRHVSVHPVECDDDALECPKCHAMSAEVESYINRDGDLVPREDEA